MRAILVTVRHPESRAEGAEYRQAPPTVGVKLLVTMTSDNSIEQVFEGGDSQSVACLYQARRTDRRLPGVIREHQMQMVADRLNRPVAQECHAKHQPYGPFCWEFSATN